jgi:ribosomal protein L29
VGGFLGLMMPQRIEKRLVAVRERLVELERMNASKTLVSPNEVAEELRDLKTELAYLEALAA